MPLLASLSAYRVLRIALFCPSVGFRFRTPRLPCTRKRKDEPRGCQLEPCHVPAPSG
ncbi:hypothetical protein CGRA01v4_04748 [Colletotrichum graminicola]|nr:hypothetical protein CGRA01v4_04748 [Colletotrichum graminicola]